MPQQIQFNPAGDLMQGIGSGMKLAQMKQNMDQQREELEMKREQVKFTKMNAFNTQLGSIFKAGSRGNKAEFNFLKKKLQRDAPAYGPEFEEFASDDNIDLYAVNPEVSKAYLKAQDALTEALRDGRLDPSEIQQIRSQAINTINTKGKGNGDFQIQQLDATIKMLAKDPSSKQDKSLGFQQKKLEFSIQKEFDKNIKPLVDDSSKLSRANSLLQLGDIRSMGQLSTLVQRIFQSGVLTEGDEARGGLKATDFARRVKLAISRQVGGKIPQEIIDEFDKELKALNTQLSGELKDRKSNFVKSNMRFTDFATEKQFEDSLGGSLIQAPEAPVEPEQPVIPAKTSAQAPAPAGPKTVGNILQRFQQGSSRGGIGRSQAFEEADAFASTVVKRVRTKKGIDAVIAQLRSQLSSVPPGEQRSIIIRIMSNIRTKSSIRGD